VLGLEAVLSPVVRCPPRERAQTRGSAARVPVEKSLGILAACRRCSGVQRLRPDHGRNSLAAAARDPQLRHLGAGPLPLRAPVAAIVAELAGAFARVYERSAWIAAQPSATDTARERAANITDTGWSRPARRAT
jgi:hypothetical protein